MHDEIKMATGIETANCDTCLHIGSEDDGNYPEYSVSLPVCRKHEHYSNLKSFPFKTEQKCWEPNFWHSKFPDMIKIGEHEEVMGLIGKFNEACDAVRPTA